MLLNCLLVCVCVCVCACVRACVRMCVYLISRFACAISECSEEFVQIFRFAQAFAGYIRDKYENLIYP